MKVYLINPPNCTVLHDHIYPLGMLFITQYLRDKGIDAHFRDMGQFVNMKFDIPMDGDVYGLGIVTAQYDMALTLIKKLKAANKRVVVGDIHSSVFSEQLLNDGADVVVHGEGEYAMYEILTQPLETVKGISYLKDGQVVHTMERPFEQDIDNFSFPHVAELGVGPYKPMYNGSDLMGRQLRPYPVIASRGCPFACVFCASPWWWQRTVRRHSIEYMENWISYLCDHGCNYVWFYDATFVTSRKWAFALCAMMKKFNRPWRCLTRADSLDEELIKTMAESGCVQIDVGTETGSQKLLDKMNKLETVEEIGKAIDLIHKYKMQTHTFFMYGFPGETQEDINKTVDFIRIHKPDLVGLSAFIPLPGCDVYKNPDKYNFKLDTNRGFKKYYWSLNEFTTPLFVPEEKMEETARFGNQIREVARQYTTLVDDLVMDQRGEGWVGLWRHIS